MPMYSYLFVFQTVVAVAEPYLSSGKVVFKASLEEKSGFKEAF